MLTIKGVSKFYGDIKILEALEMNIMPREIVSIIGPSGIGKTTLLRLIAGLTEPDEGTIERNSHKMGYVFQEDRLLPWLTVSENIRLVNPELSQPDLESLLNLARLKGSANQMPETLSGGMRQRAALVRAFAYEPDVVLMDEPFKSIDPYLKNQLIEDVLKIWQLNPKCIILITHDIDEALLLSDVLYMLSGKPAVLKKVIRVENPRMLSEAEKRTIKESVQQFWEESEI